MTPRTYCEEAIAELCSLRARWASEPEIAQRLVVLAYFAERPLSDEDFDQELEALSVGASHGQPGVPAAARTILHDWRGRVVVG